MAPKPRNDALVVSHEPLASDAVLHRDRLERVARREPVAVLGVLEYWLAPQTGEGETRADN